MDQRPICYYNTQGEMHCEVFTPNQKKESGMITALNSQGDVNIVAPFSRVYYSWPKRTVHSIANAQGSSDHIVLEKDSTAFIGMYENAPKHD